MSNPNDPDTPRDPSVEGHQPKDLLGAAANQPEATQPPTDWVAPEPADLEQLLPGYRITGFLGRGGMGAVYRGVHTALDREIAIKLLPSQLGSDPEFEARFRQEAKAMARLNHPNIVQIYDFGQTSRGHYYIVMEYVDGTDLHHFIRSGQLKAEGALNAVSQICDALEYAHSEGFVHRDIKPANIFINSKGLLKVGDFGLAKMVQSDDAAGNAEQLGLTQTGVAMGTPNYIAPEQLNEGSSVDQRADIYSLGVMFYEMLTGDVPRGSVKAPSQRVKNIDVRVDGVVFKAMEPEPDERYQSAVDLRHDVDDIRTGELPKKPSADPASSKKGLSTAAIVGIILTCVLALPLIGALAFSLFFFDGPAETPTVVASDDTKMEKDKPELNLPSIPIPLSPPGRLEATPPQGVEVSEGYLDAAEPYDDFIQVVGVREGQGRWVALRENGDVVSSPELNYPDNITNVAFIRENRYSGVYFVHRDGTLSGVGLNFEIPEGLESVVDVAGGLRNAIALHADGSITFFGEKDPDWKIPVEAFDRVISISANRDALYTLTDDSTLHYWSIKDGYQGRSIASHDPPVCFVGSWLVKGKMLSRSGLVINFDGSPQITNDKTVPATEIKYAGSTIIYRNPAGDWISPEMYKPLHETLRLFNNDHFMCVVPQQGTMRYLLSIRPREEGPVSAN